MNAPRTSQPIYRVILEKGLIFWKLIQSSHCENKDIGKHMCLILNGYQDRHVWICLIRRRNSFRCLLVGLKEEGRFATERWIHKTNRMLPLRTAAARIKKRSTQMNDTRFSDTSREVD